MKMSKNDVRNFWKVAKKFMEMLRAQISIKASKLFIAGINDKLLMRDKMCADNNSLNLWLC
uniref:Uncharacterized protein n=1 Tax=Lactococcus lactis subsp. cremoris TaxID=1359 RepID=A0A896T9P3_LACLC